MLEEKSEITIRMLLHGMEEKIRVNIKNFDKKCVALFHELTAPKHIAFGMQEAENILNGYFPDRGGSCLCDSTSVLWAVETASDEMKEVLLSIIIPTYNNAAYVSMAIESCLVQKTVLSYEIVVINDGSTDDTSKVLEKYASEEKVKIFTQDNKGFSGARNTGIQHAIGMWIMFLDSDDTLTENAIDTLLKIALEKDADIVEGNYVEVYSDGSRRAGAKIHAGFCREIEKGRVLSTLRGYPWGKVIKKSLFRDVQFPERYWFEDTVMHMVIYPMAARCFTTEKVVYEYFINPYGISSLSHGNEKCIDSFYVTRQLLENRRKLDIDFTDEDYTFFLVRPE